MTAPSRPRGYTLLEVILSLLLTSLILLCVAMAVDFQLRVADASRAHVEEAQLARVLLHRIADDIRGAATADPLGLADLAFSGTSGSTSTTYGSTSGGSDSQESDTTDSTTSGMEDMASDSSSDEITEGESTDSSESETTQNLPGIYGGENWIQIDVDRPGNLARSGRSQAGGESSSSSPGPAGDLKTIAYHMAATDASTESDRSQAGGLMRRELPRAVTNWASEQGSADVLLDVEKSLAPEVEDLLVRYSDGSAWSDSWDTTESKSLPVAVEITLRIRPIHQQGGWARTLAAVSGMASDEETEVSEYRLVVDVPMARAASDSSESETESSTTEDSNTSKTESSEESSNTNTEKSSSSGTSP
jgi:type II secretory pathway pseudopilin PulG